LAQTGDGHFSPIAAYDSVSDSCLVLDVARFKLPPYWVPLEALYLATVPPDPETGLARGWMTVRRSASAPLLISTVEDLLPTGGPVMDCCTLVAGAGVKPAIDLSQAAGSAAIAEGKCSADSAGSEALSVADGLAAKGLPCLAPQLVVRVSRLVQHLACVLGVECKIPTAAGVVEGDTPAAAGVVERKIPTAAGVVEGDTPAAAGVVEGDASMAARVVEAFVGAYSKFSTPGAFSRTRCVKRFSGPQIADARQLVADIEAWPVFSLVKRVLGSASAFSESNGACCASSDAPSDCVDIETSHSVALLLASLRHGAVERGADTTADASSCGACSATMGHSSVPGASTRAVLSQFACLQAPAPGSSLAMEASSLAVQLYALSTV
jgi:hypothetical protein